MSFYFYSLHYFGIDSFSKVLCDSFGKDIDFRVQLHNEYSYCFYSPEERVFGISIEKGVFQDSWNKINDVRHLKNTFDEMFFQSVGGDYVATCTNRVLTINKTPLDNNSLNSKYKTLYDKIFKSDKVGVVTNLIIQQLKGYLSEYNLFLPSYTQEQHNKNFEDLAKGAIALAWLCEYYDAKIEYSMSVAKVDYVQSNNKEIKVYRNLGGLIIGYDSNYQMPFSERVITNLISDRITAVVAGNVASGKREKITQQLYFTTQHEALKSGASDIIKKISFNKSKNGIEGAEKDGSFFNLYMSLIENPTEWFEKHYKMSKYIERHIKSSSALNKNITNGTLDDFLVRRRVFFHYKYVQSKSFEESVKAMCKLMNGHDATSTYISSNVYTALLVTKSHTIDCILPEERLWIENLGGVIA